MKYVIRFGVRGGYNSSPIAVADKKRAALICSSLVSAFVDPETSPSANIDTWILASNQPRMAWSSSTHYVSLEKEEANG